MKIKQKNLTSEYKNIKKIFRVRSVSRAMLIVTLFVIFEIILVFGSMFYAVQLYTSGQVNTYHEVIDHVIEAMDDPIVTVKKYVSGRMSNPKRLVIDFKFEEWQRLVEKHNEAFETRNLYASENPDFPAKIRVNGKEVDVDVRLKGSPEHFMGGKWSFRVKVRDNEETIFGMKTFSLQHPERRRFLSEWVVHKMMSREGVIALNYDFVDVVINGRHEGIYNLEEHFSKELVERNERREGPILVLSEELDNLNYWKDVWKNEIREVDSYQTTKTIKDEDLAKQFVAARSLIGLFWEEELSTCEIFECELLARYFAVLDLLGAQHSAESGNMKMYYNPVTAKLEPIVFDAESEYERKHLFLRTWSNYDATESSGWIKRIFSDSEFFEMYIRELTRIVEPEYLDKFFVDIADEMNEKLTIIYASYPTYDYDVKDVYEIQERIRGVLEAKKALDAYVDSVDGSQISLEVGTILPFPVEMRGVQCSGRRIMLKELIQLDPLEYGELIAHKIISFKLPSSFTVADCINEKLKIVYNISGRDDIRTESISLLPRKADDFSSTDVMRKQANHSTFDFISVDEVNKWIAVKSGKWTLYRDLIVPKGYVFRIGPGTELDIKESAQIISYSPLWFKGDKDNPIVITSSDKSGNGMVVLNTPDKSRLMDVEFVNLSAPYTDYWNLTGAVTFYEAPVELTRVQFRNNHSSDDALNIIRSEFFMDDVLFADVFADGFDSDFSSGEIINSQVVRAGNDGFDFSGSSVDLRNISISGAGDKGVSIGERSTIKATDIAVSDCRVGVVSKDFSDADINGLTLNNCNVGIALYQKKPEFGFGRMSVWNLSVAEVTKKFVVEKGSILALDAVAQPTESGKIADEF